MKKNPIFFSIVLFLGCFSQPLFAKEPKLIFALDVVRHGDRTPIRDIPSHVHHWQEGYGQLTPKGIQQHFELGSKLRKKYIEQTSLLPERYQPGTIFARSTDYDRTLMSAQSLLLGLYPLPSCELPTSFQPIPIHTQHATDNDALHADTHGPAFQQAYEQYVKTHATWQAKDNALKHNYPRWSKVTGIHITNLYQLISLGNTLFIYQSNNKSIPEGLTQKDVEEISAAGKWAFCFMFKPQPVAQAVGQPLLKEVFDYLKDAPHEKLKYVLLSAHDSTILALMSALGVPLEEPPPYASQVHFAVYEITPNHYKVNISYNDKLLSLPACAERMCRLEELKHLVQLTQ
ncbi:MAG: histidine-type phosphatase [Proteobacteria bacterium]|nr:histidine-type phosphatase [Pseudomonadota bacterium]